MRAASTLYAKRQRVVQYKPPPHHSFTRSLTCARSINFVRFIDGLRHVATKLRISLNKVMELVVLIGKPINAVEYE